VRWVTGKPDKPYVAFLTDILQSNYKVLTS
jgi:hypothetical protein